MGHCFLIQKLCQKKTRKLVMVMGMLTTVVLLLWQSTLLHGDSFSSAYPAVKAAVVAKGRFTRESDSPELIGVNRVFYSSNVTISTDPSIVLRELKRGSAVRIKAIYNSKIKERRMGDDFVLDEDKEMDNRLLDEEVVGASKSAVENPDFTVENPRQHEHGLPPQEPASASNMSFIGKQAAGMLESHEEFGLVQSGSATSSNSIPISTFPVVKRKKRRTTISEMNNILLQNHASYSVEPKWSSSSDRELLSLKRQIENAPIVRDDPELYAPVFRNISMFKMSYKLMERRLKIYIYKDGEKPIFHQPFLKGIFSSEGWFMKLLEGNKKFVTDQPKKAHLFYLPFCSYILRTVLFDPELNKPQLESWINLREFLENYVDKIATNYPFWNRTNGADHFFVACQDRALKETEESMQHSIRALCNADVSKGFKLGKDVPLPMTNVRSEQNPLGDLGGKPASERTTLAFFAGQLHGRLREILLQHWENKDPDMKIMGPIPRGADRRRTSYIQHMKNSKYCICARGTSVHSPRVVEAIFYECVPVILSDNYVPPFFEFLNWETFGVFVAQKDIPKLKDILLSIPEERYLIMHERVKKVQQHFLWHKKPVKYDIFHMILHSIWSSRLNQVQVK